MRRRDSWILCAVSSSLGLLAEQCRDGKMKTTRHGGQPCCSNLPCYLDMTLVGSGQVDRAACWQDLRGCCPGEAIFASGGSLVLLALFGLSCPVLWLQLEQEQSVRWYFQQVAPFEPLSPEFCCDTMLVMNSGYSILANWTLFFLFLFLLRALPCSPGLGRLGCRRCQKILG